VPAAGAQAPEAAFRGLLQRYFDAYVRKDIEAMAACWHVRGPARYGRNIVLLEFDLRSVALDTLSLRDVSADPGGGRARAVIDLTVTDAKTGRIRHERRIRDFTFLEGDDGWKIWNEASAAPQLAARLLGVPADQRDALLAREPDLASDDTLTGLGLEAGRLQSQGKFEDVLEILGLQGRLARTLGNQGVLGRTQLNSGSILMMSGRRDEAGRAFTSAREAFVADGSDGDAAACDANLANLAYAAGDFVRAADLYQRALTPFERLNDDAGMASALQGLGNALYMQTEFSRALEHYQRALAVMDRAKQIYTTAGVYQAIALVNKEQGEYAAAADAWRRALAVSETTKDRNGVARALGGIAEIFRLQGDLARALEYQTKCVAEYDRLRLPVNRASARFALGQLHALQRSFERAIEQYQQALTLDEGGGNAADAAEAGIARDLGGLGGAHFALGDADLALTEYQRSLALRERLKDDPGVMWTLIHIGVLHASRGRYDEAIAANERSLTISEASKEQSAIATALALRANASLQQGHAEDAVAAATRATEVATSIEHFDTVAYAKTVIGKAHQKAGRNDQALAALEESVAALAKVPLGPAAETFFDNRRAPYLALVDLLVGSGRTEEAFVWAERGRQRALADQLGEGGMVVSKGLTPAERDEERRLMREARTVGVKIRRERGRAHPDTDRVRTLAGQLSTLEREREKLRQTLYDSHRALRGQRAQNDAIGVSGVAPLLRLPSTVILAFAVSDARTWVFAVGRATASAPPSLLQVATIEVRADQLAQQVRKFRDAIANQGDGVDALSQDLHSLLLAPVQAAIEGRKRIIIIPDAFLWLLPFEALVTPSGHYLIEGAAISYAPSLTSLVTVAGSTPDPRAPTSLVAFADPLLGPAATSRLALLRPTAASKSPASAEREVRRASLLFAQVRRKMFFRGDARWSQVARGVATGSVLHVAVPGFLSEAAPLYSLLAMAPDGDTDGADGLTEIASFMDCELPATVAVLTRVEAGLGPNGGGDALTTLFWSLFVAGTPQVAINRWLPPATGFPVIAAFYRSFLTPSRTARPAPPEVAFSLQRAMKSTLAQPATRHPYHWAGFMVIGGR
jgi:tetratricopeptide (TPR) repeat protein